MPSGAEHISEKSKRIARNTLLLYFRMLVLMLVGLFTSRIVLRELGVEDYGVYNAVGGVVSVFTLITASISSAISRFMTYELGRGGERLKRIFATSVVIQLLFALGIIILVETVGMWFLSCHIVLPEGRLAVAKLVLHTSVAVLFFNLVSIPYNATIIAHERMSAFAWISLLEAGLKLAVALLLSLVLMDKLELYAILMLAVAVVVRVVYGLYCGRHFEESHIRGVRPDRALTREMFGFASWNFFGSSAYVINTHGVNLVVNVFFGVVMNAARGVATQIETIVKQFVANFLTALNPQITKSWASGDREYCFELVRKGIKFSFLAQLVLFVPFLFGSELLLGLWLVEVPAEAALFVRLTLIALMVDMLGNSALTLILATGKIRRYYLLTGLTSYLCLPLAYLVFRLGVGAWSAYLVFAVVYVVVQLQRFKELQRLTGFSLKSLRAKVLWPLFAVSALSLGLGLGVHLCLGDSWWSLACTCLVAWLGLALSSFLWVLTKTERCFVLAKIERLLPDGLAVRSAYYRAFGRVPDLREPKRYTEWVQWMKLRDHNPLYHKLVDKQEVKSWVSNLIGPQSVIPTIALYDKAEDIAWDALPEQFVIKCTHDSGSTIVCSDKSTFDREEASARLKACLETSHYRRFREWAYKGVRPRIIVEKFMGSDLKDYKFFCFEGRVEFLFVASERSAGTTKFDFFDRDFRHLDIRNGHPNAAPQPQKPLRFEEMRSVAEKLSGGLPHVRVDLYEIEGKVYFGEYTFYHWGGLVPFEPESTDEWCGSFFKRK